MMKSRHWAKFLYENYNFNYLANFLNQVVKIKEKLSIMMLINLKII